MTKVRIKHIEDLIEPAPIRQASLAKPFPEIAVEWYHKKLMIHSRAPGSLSHHKWCHISPSIPVSTIGDEAVNLVCNRVAQRAGGRTGYRVTACGVVGNCALVACMANQNFLLSTTY